MLSTPQSLQRFMRVAQPEQSQQADNEYLTDYWEVVDQEGTDPATQSRFDQI